MVYLQIVKIKRIVRSKKFDCRCNNAFTLPEILIAAGILSMFIAGLFTLYTRGQLSGNTAYWLQKTIGQLRNATKHFAQNIQKSSYPTTIVYPAKIIENTSNNFNLRINSQGLIKSENCISQNNITKIATKIVWFVESKPEKIGFEPQTQAELIYHVYSLSKEGKLLYHKFTEKLAFTSPPNYIKDITISDIPPNSANLVEYSVLAEDVEQIKVEGISNDSSLGKAVSLEITCKYPKGHTRRIENITVVPNVEISKSN